MKHIIAAALATALVAPAYAAAPGDLIDPCGCLPDMEALMPPEPPFPVPASDAAACAGESYQHASPDAVVFQHSVQTPQSNVNIQVAQGSGTVLVNRQIGPVDCK
jgi:hypothetical protein